MKNIKEYLKPEDIEFFLANTPQITFEVTDACNFKVYLLWRIFNYGQL
jgi:hypothetical protein